MPRVRAMAFGVTLAAVCAGCGSESGAPGEVPLSEMDLGSSLGRGVDGYGYEEDTSRQSSDMERPASSGVYESLLAAQDRDLQATCGCTFDDEGFASEAECFELKRRPEFDRQCSISAFEA